MKNGGAPAPAGRPSYRAPRRPGPERAYPPSMDLSGVGRLLLILAVVIAVVGVILILVGRGLIPRMPGDISIERDNFRFYFPLGTSIVVSVVLTLVLNLFLRR
jgi:hypothetical protein